MTFRNSNARSGLLLPDDDTVRAIAAFAESRESPLSNMTITGAVETIPLSVYDRVADISNYAAQKSG